MKKLISLLLTATLLTAFTGCSLLREVDRGGSSEPELVHYLHDGDNLTLRYFDGIDYTGIKYEEIAYQSNDRLAVGPSEPWYAGVLYVEGEEAERLWDEYEWVECAFPHIDLYDVEVGDIDTSSWYTSADFDQEISNTGVQVIDIVYNGSEIVFYLKTF